MNKIYKNKKIYIISFICIVLGLQSYLTYIGYSSELKKEKNNINQYINNISQDIIDNLFSQINLIKHNIDRNNAIFTINGKYMSQKNFTNFIQFNSLPIRNSIEHYFWSPIIYQYELNNYNNFGKQYILPNFTVTQLNENFAFVPVSNRTRYIPISLFAPPFNNPTIIGLDFLSFPQLAVFIEDANTTQHTISRRISLSNAISENSFAFLVVKPSFNNFENLTEYNKIGYMMAITDVIKMLHNILNILSLDISDIDFLVFDINNQEIISQNLSLLYKPNNDIYKNIFFQDDLILPEYSINRQFNILNKVWSINIIFSDNFIKNNFSNIPLITLLGLVIGFIIIDLILIFIIKYFIMIKKQNNLNKEKKNIAYRMLGYVNHEIRNPLNGITGLTENTLTCLQELLSKNNINLDLTNEISENDLQKKYIKVSKNNLINIISDLHTVNRSSEFLCHIVNDILDIRKLEEGELELEYENIKIKDLINDIKKIIQTKFNEKHHLEFVVNIYDENDIIYIPSLRVKQLLLNFLTNSIKFTDNGSIKLKIKKLESSLYFEVTDTGRGIPNEKKPLIFEPFKQINTKDSSRYGGIGLGLYLCKMLVQNMQGTIGFNSEIEKGSTFWFKLPIKKSEDNVYEMV